MAEADMASDTALGSGVSVPHTNKEGTESTVRENMQDPGTQFSETVWILTPWNQVFTYKQTKPIFIKDN